MAQYDLYAPCSVGTMFKESYWFFAVHTVNGQGSHVLLKLTSEINLLVATVISHRVHDHKQKSGSLWFYKQSESSNLKEAIRITHYYPFLSLEILKYKKTRKCGFDMNFLDAHNLRHCVHYV